MCLGQQEKGFGTPEHLWEMVLGGLLECRAQGNLRGRADHLDYKIVERAPLGDLASDRTPINIDPRSSFCKSSSVFYSNRKPIALPSNESLDVAQTGLVSVEGGDDARLSHSLHRQHHRCLHLL
ncbi:hypothetical protein NE237_028332 [Protea cynaroides]|uniref:Uncharacterized protein n=1 Tax=Protea cynaroides TaxID=273540 RepID=A0A9Q0JV11_9MAGN|nr:hypothetical protein NE237_028332 [Protea cynaroides]